MFCFGTRNGCILGLFLLGCFVRSVVLAIRAWFFVVLKRMTSEYLITYLANCFIHWRGLIFSAHRVIAAAGLVEKERARRLGTSILNQVVWEALAFKAPPRTRGGRRGRVYYCTQVLLTVFHYIYH